MLQSKHAVLFDLIPQGKRQTKQQHSRLSSAFELVVRVGGEQGEGDGLRVFGDLRFLGALVVKALSEGGGGEQDVAGLDRVVVLYAGCAVLADLKNKRGERLFQK